jgi:hypothetical protein
MLENVRTFNVCFALKLRSSCQVGWFSLKNLGNGKILEDGLISLSLIKLQALRYAAMVSTLTFGQAVSTYRGYLAKLNLDRDAHDDILTFLDWPEPDEARFAQDVRIVLVSAEFSKEITTTAIWLNQRGLDIRCIRLKPVSLGERLIVDVQQIIPLPEAAEYQVRVREKEERERAATTSNGTLAASW